MDKLTTGVYAPTREFRLIEEHTAVCDAASGGLVAICGPAYDEDSEAVARLFAASPDLLGALQAVLRGFETGDFRRTHPRQADSDPYHPALVAARAAIAKAEKGA